MPRGFVDDPEGDVADEKVDDGGFGDDILAADADGVDVLLLNVGQHHATAVADDLCRGIDDKGVGFVLAQPDNNVFVIPIVNICRSEIIDHFIQIWELIILRAKITHSTIVSTCCFLFIVKN